MNQRIAIASTLLFVCGCVGISPHSDSTSITDVEISMYKFGIHKGCTDQGISRGDDPAKVTVLCDCALNTLNQSLTHEQWQAATYAAQNKHDDDEARVLAPAVQKMGACKNGA